MKITLEPYAGGNYTLVSNAEHIETTIELFKLLLVRVGYEPKTIERYFTNYNES